MSRLEKLKEMLRAEPNDVFLQYALAMELRSGGQLAESLEALRGLIRQSKYTPAYFMAGQVLAERGELEEARMMLRHGIDRARAERDHFAAAEMSEFLASLGAAGD